jgi:hypothetical protein
VNSAIEVRAEAARYALLRRLAPALRHGMVGKLHPVSLMSETLARRLRAAPDASNTRDSLEKIHQLARSAIAACAGLVGWLAPEDEAGIALEEAVAECVSLLGTDFSMHGHQLRSELATGQATVSQSAVRNLLCAALIAQVDSFERPVDMVIRAGQVPGALVVEWADSTREALPLPEVTYRRLGWEDVQALAVADCVQCERSAGRILLHFARQGSAAQPSP